MAYATQQDLVDRFGAAELTQLTDRADEPTGVPDAVVVAAALADATNLVDGYAAERYAVPLSPVPELVRRLACDIARYYLHKDSPTEAVLKAHDDAVKTLRDVAAGRVKLQVAGAAAAEAAGGAVQTAGPARLFDHDALKGF